MRCHTVRLTAAGHGRLTLGIDAAGLWTDRPDRSWPEAELGDGVVYPGLVDGHAHLTSNEVSDMTGESRDDGLAARIARHASSQLAHGVLLLVDKGTHDPATVELTLGISPEERPAAQLAGRFLAGIDGYYPHLAVEVAPGGLAGAVDAATPDPATWVKLIGDWPRRGVGAVPSFTEAEMAAGVAAAHAAGRRVAIHTAAPDTPGRAVRAGVDSIEHGLFLTEDDVVRLGERGGAWVPTVRAMELLMAALGEGSSGGKLLREGLDNVERLLPHAAAAGVFVMAGTDLALGHGEVAREAKALVAYGMAEEDVLVALTSGPRTYLGEPAFLPGSCADLVVVPAADVASLATPRLVLRCGRVVVDARV